MSKGFESFFKRLCAETEIKNQSQLARELDVGRAAVSLAKRKDSVPARWILDLSNRFGLNSLWLEKGKGFPGRKTLPESLTRMAFSMKRFPKCALACVQAVVLLRRKDRSKDIIPSARIG